MNAQLTLVGGKGGVGKTTVAAALAIDRADAGQEVLLLSIDPAHSLGDALLTPLGADPRPVPGVPRLSALEVDADLERRRFLEDHRGALLSLIERGTYLDAADAAGFVDLSIPGIDELAALFRLRSLLDSPARQLVVDTAPTGHTLRLLELPQMARGWLAALQAMEDRHRAVSAALVGTVLEDDASRLLQEIDEDLGMLEDLFTDPQRSGFVLVTSRDPVVMAETLRYQAELARRRIRVVSVVVNRAAPLARPAPGGSAIPMWYVPPLPHDPVGVARLREFGRHLREAPADGGRSPVAAGGAIRAGEPFTPPLDRELYLVGGKGGVGKSTAAAALAVRLAGAGRRVLLLSADPAGSLGDVLDLPVGAPARPVAGIPGLEVLQLEAHDAWATLRERYRAEAEQIFAGLVGGEASLSADHGVVGRLLDLAPPGIDELVALVEVVDATEDRLYDALVVDTAPTGHFLRLLELPEIALEWTHQVMRLLLKYREVVPLGELAERLLDLARTLRRFSARLRDPRSAWILVVALPEALSVPETARLLGRLHELGIAHGALLVNRILHEGVPRAGVDGHAAALLELGGGLPVVGAPDEAVGPRGVGPLADFARTWRTLHRVIPDEPLDDRS